MGIKGKCGRKAVEKWEPVKFTNGKYVISCFGRIKSVYSLTQNMRIKMTGTLLKPQINWNGYPIIGLSWYVEGVKKKKKIFIHRLVGEAFVPNPDNKPQINHKNGIKNDNDWRNLEWVTNLENTHHAQKIGLKPTAKPKIYKGHKGSTPKPIIDLNTGIFWTSCEVAFLLGTSKKEVCRMINEERKPNTSQFRYA